MLSRIRFVGTALLVLPMAFMVGSGVARSDGPGVADEVEETAEELKENIEHSDELAKKTYESDRKQGEGRVEAAGNAYEAVLEAGRDKSEEQSEAKK